MMLLFFKFKHSIKLRDTTQDFGRYDYEFLETWLWFRTRWLLGDLTVNRAQHVWTKKIVTVHLQGVGFSNHDYINLVSTDILFFSLWLYWDKYYDYIVYVSFVRGFRWGGGAQMSVVS